MPRPGILTAALLALTSLTTATPLPNPNTSPNPSKAALTPRADYHPGTNLSNSDYCNEAVPQFTYGPSTPLVSDCQAMPPAHPGPGYWTISPEETLSSPDRWVRLAEEGTCAFDVRLGYGNGQDDGHVVGYRFGTNDLGFFVRSHAGKEEAQDGRVGVWSGVYCMTSRVEGEGGVRVLLEWRVVHA